MPQNISCLVGICTVCKQEKCPLFGNRKIYTSHLGKCMGLGNCINCLSCTQIWSGVEFQKIFATLIGNDRYNHIQCKYCHQSQLFIYAYYYSAIAKQKINENPDFILSLLKDSVHY